MKSHVCSVCGYRYEPDRGDPDAKIPAGTDLLDLPEDWKCPTCHEGKTAFHPVEEDTQNTKGAVRHYSRPELTVIWQSALCDHNGNCIRSLPQVFDLKKRPWVNVDGAEADEIRRVVDQCPTGALTYKDHRSR